MDLDQFLHENIAAYTAWEGTPMAERVESWLNETVASGRRVALVTSGGTTVPLERRPVRFLTNFSSGSRGSKIAEALLARGWRVLFLHRKGSLMPFHRVLQTSHEPLALLADGGEHSDATLRSALHRYALHRGDLLTVEFDTVFSYLYSLRLLAKALQLATASQQLGRPWIILPAAVSDYYVPVDEMSEHKISTSDSLTIVLRPTPKALGLLRVWAPDCAIVSFKLETDPEVLDRKASSNLRKYANDAVVANLLDSHTTRMIVYTAPVTDGDVTKAELVAPTAEHPQQQHDQNIEDLLVEYLGQRLN